MEQHDAPRLRGFLAAMVVALLATQVLVMAGRLDLSRAIALPPALFWLGALLPVLRLHRCFHLTPRSEDPREGVLVVAGGGVVSPSPGMSKSPLCWSHWVSRVTTVLA